MYCQVSSVNSGWSADFLEHAHVGLEPRHGAVPGRLRNPLGERAGTEAVAPFVEAGGCGVGGERRREQRGRAKA